MPFPIPTPQEIREQCESEIQTQFPNAQPRLKNSFLGILCRMIALAVHGMYIYLSYIKDQIFAVSADAQYLDSIGTEIGVDRLEATAATGTIEATGVNGSAIPVSTQLIDSNGIIYETTEADVISAGVASIPVESVKFGSNTNQQDGVTLTFVSPPSGIDTVATVESPGILGGSDREDDESYRQRIIDRKRRPIQCGTASDYEQWALEVPDVTRAFVFPQEDGAGTVRVRFMMDDKYANGIPLSGDVTEVFNHISSKMPINVSLFVSAPTPVSLNISAKILPFNATIQAAVETELDDLFRRDTVPGGGLLISRIREAISNAAGEEDNILQSPSADVTTASSAEILVPGTYTIISI